jgi:hypothetical protein
MAESRLSDCLLIVNGHTSRACPLALEILRRFCGYVLIILLHTSHICQFFDGYFLSGWRGKNNW